MISNVWATLIRYNRRLRVEASFLAHYKKQLSIVDMLVYKRKQTQQKKVIG